MHVISRVRAPPICGAFCSLTSRSLFWPVGWLGMCVSRVVGDHGKKRWSSPGSRCDIHQAPGHPRILLPLYSLPNSPASGLASSHSGVARNDCHRTVSFHNQFPWISSLLALLETPSLSLFPSIPSPFSLPLTFTHPLVMTRVVYAQGSNRRADPSQTRPVKGTAYSRASTRKRDVEGR